MTINEAVKEVVGNGTCIHTLTLQDRVINTLHNGKEPMTSTILRELRRLRTQGYDVKCVDQKRSLYKVVKL